MFEAHKQKSTFQIATYYMLMIMSVVASILILGWILKYSSYGVDFTDESFYLVWIADPFIYDASVYLFGFIYHPLFRFLGGDVVALRQMNILIIFCLAWILAYVFLIAIAPDLKENRITKLTVSSGIAISALTLFSYGLFTPSYNSLNLKSLLITTTGLILAQKFVDRKSIIGWILIGFGGWLAFMAKPTTALALSFCVLIYLLLARKFSIRLLLMSIACSLILLFMSAFLIDGSVNGFLSRIILGIEFLEYLEGGHTVKNILTLNEFQVEKKLKISIALLSLTLFFGITSISAKDKHLPVIGLLISVMFFLITALLSLDQIHRTSGFSQFQGLLLFGLIFAILMAVLVIGGLKTLKTYSIQEWALAFIFLLMPHIYALGTNTNYWSTGSAAGIFWLFGGIIFLAPLMRDRTSCLIALPLVLAAQSVTAILLQTGFEHPYRQPQPLRLNTSVTEFGHNRSLLTLSDDYSIYIASSMAIAKKVGFEPNTPLIDLSGQSPGILFAINAKGIGQPWTLGGYPGSLAFVKAGLAQFSCEDIANAWILFEPRGPRSISPELLTVVGSNFPESYELVGSWETARGAGGYPDSRIQEFYKPIKQNQTLFTCKKNRESVSQ